MLKYLGAEKEMEEGLGLSGPLGSDEPGVTGLRVTAG